MSTSQSLKRGPKRPQRPVARLDSIKNPQPRPVPQAKTPRVSECPNPDCGQRDSGINEDGKIICRDCGTVIQELNMVSELTYGLAMGGQHVVHGYHVGADQTYAKRGDVVDPNRAMSSREVSVASGHRYISQIGIALGMNIQLREMGLHIYKLAIGGFIQGRRIKSVAAVALYVACRTQKDTNTYMLIDFADVLEIDVFNLGRVYTALLDHIRLNGIGWVVQPINPEDLILRFCHRLEFGSETMRVARDAVRIVQRMNRDWMTPGRRPAGICGAALILAARMNNFRRTVREVVYVVKVQEQTIFNRLDEFKITESSGLTVDEFRTIDLERTADPPIFTAQKEGPNGKRKRGRKRKHIEFDDDGDNDQPTVISSRASSVTPSVMNDQGRSATNLHQQPKLDSRNMPPPPIPIDPNLSEKSHRLEAASSLGREASALASVTQNEGNPESTESPRTGIVTGSSSKANSEQPTKRKRGRPPKKVPDKPVTPPATQRTDDPALEADITIALTDPLNLAHANALSSALDSVSNPPSPPATQQEPSDQPPRKGHPIPDTEEISDSEFADDPEVSNCLLSPDEVSIKTRIWTHENREYLRIQAAKILKQRLAEENGTARQVVRRKRKRRRMGDMTAYLGEDGEEGRPVAGSPAEAVMQMMSRRTYSKKLNYAKIKSIYEPSSSGTSTRRGSVSVVAQGPRSDVGATAVGTPREDDQAAERQPSEVRDDESVVDAQDKNEQQKELDAIAGELEEEGINDDAVEVVEEEEEEEDDEEDAVAGRSDDDDDDPYQGGDDSD